jgi:Glycosyl hydrolase family 3 C-terminal domain
MAADCDVAGVFASQAQAQGKGMDRGSIGWPGDQDPLIAAVAVGYPGTVVVLITRGPVEVRSGRLAVGSPPQATR